MTWPGTFLGRWHEHLAEAGPVKRAAARILYGEVPEGSSEEAVKCFLEAIKLSPNRLSHHIELGIRLCPHGPERRGSGSLEKGLAMPNVDKGDAEVKRRGREALAGPQMRKGLGWGNRTGSDKDSLWSRGFVLLFAPRRTATSPDCK